jgi:hypothetical protein
MNDMHRGLFHRCLPIVGATLALLASAACGGATDGTTPINDVNSASTVAGADAGANKAGKRCGHAKRGGEKGHVKGGKAKGHPGEAGYGEGGHGGGEPAHVIGHEDGPPPPPPGAGGEGYGGEPPEGRAKKVVHFGGHPGGEDAPGETIGFANDRDDDCDDDEPGGPGGPPPPPGGPDGPCPERANEAGGSSAPG